jgi:hypothetical protein
MIETCEAEILIDETGEELFAVLVPGLVGLPMCRKPAVDKQDFMGHPAFDVKFPPRRLCAKHWDEWIKLMQEAPGCPEDDYPAKNSS